MQDPKHNSHSRKRWYQRAMDVATRWKTINPKPTEIPRAATNITMWKSSTISRSSSSSSSDLTNATVNNNNNVNSRQKMRRCTSLKLASSFTRVCLCAPIASSYTDVFQMEYVPPRRSYSYPRSKPPNYNNHNNNNIPIAQQQQLRGERRTTTMMISSARMSTSGSEGRRIFRGKSLTDDVLMRRFVVEEEAAMMQVRRRNEMDIIRRRASLIKRKRLGPSPLSRMVLAEELDEDVHEY
ncbi:uncharacterized protein LOC124921770 [Impatiens glandulifera]|uniref:uncharacterized protein LOC124921770 n=1 Tax=Impatiens glandulifera TaxID=253017 RepID=UPI001FB0527D|nr:uncharacterized protein LOC124921770 [Impatiens glandulifera]